MLLVISTPKVFKLLNYKGALLIREDTSQPHVTLSFPPFVLIPAFCYNKISRFIIGKNTFQEV